MYSVSEVAKLLKVSRQTIYNKIDKENLQEYLQDTEKGKVISIEGFEVLKSMLSSSNDAVNRQSNTVNQNRYIDILVDSLKSLLIHHLTVVRGQGGKSPKSGTGRKK